MTLSVELVRVMLDKRGKISDAVRSDALRHVLDNLGIAMAASRRSPVAAQLMDGFSSGASGECAVIGRDIRMPAASAAFVNSALAHIMDYDDSHDIARVHPTTPVLAAALAAGELTGASGRKVLDGVIIGVELVCRLGLICKPLGTGPASNWLLTQLLGYFGASLAAGVVMDLSETEIVSAFGLAYMQAGGAKESLYGMGSTARGIYPAFAAQVGIQAAMLARAGILGPSTCFEGTAGLFPVYLDMVPTEEDRQVLLNPEGWNWEGVDFKPWPSCRSSHAYVSVALALHDPVRTAHIKHVTVAVNARAGRLCKPIEGRRRPATLADAKYSIPFLTAFTLVKGEVNLRVLNESALGDPDVLALAQKVETQETLKDMPGHAPAHIIVEMDDGSIIERKLTDSLKLEDAQVQEKFVDCLTHAGLGDQARPIWDRLSRFDDLSVSEIFATLGGRVSALESV
jgi:2-methylcitrate dehydratase PrpD